MSLSLEDLTRLLLASLDDLARLSTLLDTTMQQSDQPAFELSHDGVIWYLNRAACSAIGLGAQQAVGTRLVTYVADGLMTQRRLDALSQHTQAQSWSDAWQREQQTIPCQLMGFAIPHSLASERPRLILWATPMPEERQGMPYVEDGEATTTPLIPENRPVQVLDLEPLRDKLGLGINRFCELIGMTTATWYLWHRTPEAPVSSRPIALHMRLLDTFPDLAKSGPHPMDLQEALRTQRGIDLSYTELALLMGVERRAGFGWSRGYPPSEQIRALTTSLLSLLANRSRQDWEQYQHLLNQQAIQEGVDLRTAKSWLSNTPRDAKDPAKPTKPKPDRPFGRKPKSQTSGQF